MKYIFDMYFIFSTSNHNPTRQTSSKHIVVSHSDSTSNHNLGIKTFYNTIIYMCSFFTKKDI